MLQQAKTVLHFHQTPATVSGNCPSTVSEPTRNLTSRGSSAIDILGNKCVSVVDPNIGQERNFHFDKVLTRETAEDQVYESAVKDHQLVDAVLSGRSATVLAFGLNATKTSNYKRSLIFQQLLQDMDEKITAESNSIDCQTESRLSFSCLGLSDSRCVNLLTEKTLPLNHIEHGFTEPFFEPVNDMKEVIEKLRVGFSTPGYVLVVRMERVPARMMISIDSDIDKNRNVFRSVLEAATVRPTVGTLVLANLGAIRLHDGDHALNGLSSSVNAIRHWITEFVPPIGFSSATENAAISQKSPYPLVTLLEPFLGGNNNLLMLMDVEEFKVSPDLMNGLALGEAFRKIKTKLFLNSFDERVAVLWKMEEKFKDLRKAFDASVMEVDAQRQVVEDLTNVIKKQQLKNTELVECVHMQQQEAQTTEQAYKEKMREYEDREASLLEAQQSLLADINEHKKTLKTMEERAKIQSANAEEISAKLQKELSEDRERHEEFKKGHDVEVSALKKSLKNSEAEAERYKLELAASRDLMETLKSTIGQLGQSQTELASQLGQSANRSVTEIEKCRTQWDAEKKELLEKLQQLESELAAKRPESGYLKKQVTELEKTRADLADRTSRLEHQLESMKSAKLKAESQLALLREEQKCNVEALPESRNSSAELMRVPEEMGAVISPVPPKLPLRAAVDSEKTEKDALPSAVGDRARAKSTACEHKKKKEKTRLKEEEASLHLDDLPAKRSAKRKVAKVSYVEDKEGEYSETSVPKLSPEKRPVRGTRKTAKEVYSEAESVDATVPMNDDGEMENGSPNKRNSPLPEVTKKRRLLATKKTMQEPERTNESGIPAFPSKTSALVKKLSIPSTSSGTKSKERGIINPAALQLIKAGFSLPKLKK